MRRPIALSARLPTRDPLGVLHARRRRPGARRGARFVPLSLIFRAAREPRVPGTPQVIRSAEGARIEIAPRFRICLQLGSTVRELRERSFLHERPAAPETMQRSALVRSAIFRPLVFGPDPIDQREARAPRLPAPGELRQSLIRMRVAAAKEIKVRERFRSLVGGAARSLDGAWPATALRDKMHGSNVLHPLPSAAGAPAGGSRPPRPLGQRYAGGARQRSEMAPGRSVASARRALHAPRGRLAAAQAVPRSHAAERTYHAAVPPPPCSGEHAADRHGVPAVKFLRVEIRGREARRPQPVVRTAPVPAPAPQPTHDAPRGRLAAAQAVPVWRAVERTYRAAPPSAWSAERAADRHGLRAVQFLPVEIRWREAKRPQPVVQTAPAPAPAPQPPPDLARLTREVSREFEKRLRVERERRGRL